MQAAMQRTSNEGEAGQPSCIVTGALPVRPRHLNTVAQPVSTAHLQAWERVTWHTDTEKGHARCCWPAPPIIAGSQ